MLHHFAKADLWNILGTADGQAEEAAQSDVEHGPTLALRQRGMFRVHLSFPAWLLQLVVGVACQVILTEATISNTLYTATLSHPCNVQMVDDEEHVKSNVQASQRPGWA